MILWVRGQILKRILRKGSLLYHWLCLVVITLSNLVLNLLLLEIASALQIHEGIAIELRTAGSVAEVAFGLIIGLLSIHFKHKLLLMTGALLIIVSAVGNFLASSFNMLLFSFFLEGAGSVIVSVMALTLAGDLLNLKKKTKAISWITAAGFIAVFIGTLVITYVASLYNWRYTFMLIVLPFSIIALVLSFSDTLCKIRFSTIYNL